MPRGPLHDSGGQALLEAGQVPSPIDPDQEAQLFQSSSLHELHKLGPLKSDSGDGRALVEVRAKREDGRP